MPFVCVKILWEDKLQNAVTQNREQREQRTNTNSLLCYTVSRPLDLILIG